MIVRQHRPYVTAAEDSWQWHCGAGQERRIRAALGALRDMSRSHLERTDCGLALAIRIGDEAGESYYAAVDAIGARYGRVVAWDTAEAIEGEIWVAVARLREGLEVRT